MIRAVALLLLCASPASAQDFRGLLPGMPVSALGPIGEPLRLQTVDGFTSAIYPLPFERTLGVIHADGQIVAVTLATSPSTRLRPPPSDGLQVGETELHEAMVLAGSDGHTFELAEYWQGFPPTGGFLSYSLADHPNLGLSLLFFGHADPALNPEEINSAADMPQDAVLTSATLYDLSSIERFPMLAEMQWTPPPPDATPFALPLNEAFPPIEIPQ